MHVRVLIHVCITVRVHPAACTDIVICFERVQISGTRAESEKACAPHQAGFRLLEELIWCSEEQ